MIYENVKHLVLYAFLFSNIVFSYTFAQQPGDLDAGFGTDGVLTVDAQSLGLQNRVSQISTQPDGKIIFVGGVRNASGTEGDHLIGRVTSEGVLDLSFGNQGTTITSLGGLEGLIGLRIEPSGSILCVGSSNQSGSYEHAIVRFDSAGNLDLSFGSNGVLYNLPLSTSSVPTSIEFDSSNNLYVTGTSNGDILLSKYGSNSFPIPSFGTSGSESLDLGLVETSTELALQNDGKVVLAGSQAESGFPENVIVVRLTANGMLDQTFNGTGWVNLMLSTGIDRPSDMIVLPDGRILVVGIAANQSVTSLEAFALRLMPDGSYDNSFGTNGLARYDIGTGDDYASAVVLQPDGKAIIGGGTNDNSTILNEDFLLLRINEDGSIDQSFGNNGVVVTEISSSYERIIDMELQTNGKLIVAGTAKIGSSEEAALARYHTGLNISVNEVDEIPLFSAFPNPAIDHLSISAKVKLQTIELIDALGRSVLSFAPNAGQLQIDIASLPNGIYLFRATDGKRVTSQRFVKE